MGLCVPCAHMSECIPYRDTMRNSVKMSKKRSAKQKRSATMQGGRESAGKGVGFKKLYCDSTQG